MPTGVGIEMILHLAEFAVASPQVPAKTVFLCCTRSRAVGISAVYDTHDERVDTIFLPLRQTTLVDIAHHIASGKVLNHYLFSAVGSNDAINCSQHAEVIAEYLLEITQLIFCIETNAPGSIKAPFGCTLMLYQFHQGLEEQPVVKLLLCFGISEHQLTCKVQVVRNGQDITASAGIGALLAQRLLQFKEVVLACFIGRYGCGRHLSITKNDVSMHVVPIRRIGIFISDKRGELAVR